MLRHARRLLARIAPPPAKRPAGPPEFVILGTSVHVDAAVAYRRHEGEIRVGDNVTIWRHTELCAPVTIGSGTFINRDVYVRPFTVIGRNVSIGPFSRLVSDTHEIGTEHKRAGKTIYKPIRVGDGVWIGAAATVLGGVTLGDGCVVAAGAVVTRDVPPNAIVAGVPARVIRTLEPLTKL